MKEGQGTDQAELDLLQLLPHSLVRLNGDSLSDEMMADLGRQLGRVSVGEEQQGRVGRHKQIREED